MNNTLNKISFNDKEDFVNYNEDSKYILTAANVNEIKNVVNDLIDEFSNILTYEQIFKYIRFNVPNNLAKNQFYSLKIQLSENSDFLNVNELNCYQTNNEEGTESYELEEDESGSFSIFKNNIWKTYKNLILTSDDEDTEVKINIENIIKNSNSVPFFGRYKLINLSTSDESEWFGFILGFSNYKIDDFFQTDLKEIRINGKTEIFGKSINSYNLIGINIENDKETEIDLTSEATFSLISSSSSSLVRNILTTPNIQNEEVIIIKAEYVYSDITYTAFLPIYIKPLQILKFYIDGPNEIPEGTEKEYLIKAICKDGKELDLTESCNISIESRNCTYRISENGKLIISCINGSYDDEIFTINATFLDEDTNITYYTSKTLYISKILYNTFRIDFRFNNEEEEIIKTYNNNYLCSLGSLENYYIPSAEFKVSILSPALHSIDKTKDIQIYEIGTSYLNIETITEENDENLNYIKNISLKSLNDIEGEKDIILLFVYNDLITGKSIIKTFFIKIIVPINNNIENIRSLSINCSKNSLYDNDSIQYTVYGITPSNQYLDITDLCRIEVKTPILGYNIDYNNHTINTENLSREGTGYIKATYNNYLVDYAEIYFINYINE